MLDTGSTMETIQLAIGITLLIAVALVKLKVLKIMFWKSNLTEEEQKFRSIKRVYKPLKKGLDPNQRHIVKYAKDIQKRALLWELLNKFDRINLFPKEYGTIEKLAESHLANWLNVNDDYDAIPDEIEYSGDIQMDETWRVLQLRFKYYEPHILTKKGWMHGYVGYDKDWEKRINPKFIKSSFEGKE